MQIGFDAKRAFLNRSGLGNYSRDVIRALAKYGSDHHLHLYTPLLSRKVNFQAPVGTEIHLPEGNPGKLGQAYWRSFRITDRLRQDKINIFHGLSNELPRNLSRNGIRSVVTIHDLIFLRYPHWYPLIDRNIYRAKFRHACESADHIVAISRQTHNDIIEFFGIPKEKVSVVYQSCNEAFKREISASSKKAARDRHQLPEKYALYVGTIEPRKNLLSILRAINEGRINFPLVVIGRKTRYFEKVQAYISKHQMKKIQFLSEVSVEELPAIYQQATVFLYPSVFEGFGIPILEALWSEVPVITSTGGCFAEVGGPHSLYINPESPEEIAAALTEVLNDDSRRVKMQTEGLKHARNFSAENLAGGLLKIYSELAHA